jgi:hypothetical protein
MVGRCLVNGRLIGCWSKRTPECHGRSRESNLEEKDLSFISIGLPRVTEPHDIYVCYSLIGLVVVS